MTEVGTASPSTVGSTATTRRPDIQGLRAVAVLAVVAFHSGLPVPGGFVGVDVFFVISGFVITLMLRREWLSTGRVRLGTFYRRRFQRLAPALAVMVVFTVIVSAFVLSPFGFQQRAAQTAVGAELSVANFVITFTTGGYFDNIAEVNPLLHTWSLSVEEQFYLVFPGILLVAWLIVRRLRAGWIPMTLLLLGVAVSFGLAIVSSTGWTPRVGASLLGFYSPFTRAWEFGVGAALALMIGSLSRLPGAARAVSGWLGGAMVLASLWLITENTPFPGVWTALPVVGTGLVLVAGVAGASGSSFVPRILGTRWPVRIGDWSYSIYLWHWPLIVFALLLWPDIPGIALIAALISFIPALASYYWVEQPIRIRRVVRRRFVVGLVAVTLVPPIVLAVILYQGAERGWGVTAVQEAQAAGGSKGSGLPPDCMNYLTIKGLQPANLDACVFNADATGEPLYLLGDSNAGMHATAMKQAAADLGRPLYVSTAADCPFSDIVRESQWGATADRACRTYYEESLAWLTSAKPGTVVLASSIRYGKDSTYLIGSGSSALASGEQERAANLQKGLLTTVRALQDAGQRVVLVEPTFRFETPSTPLTVDRCSAWAVARGACPVVVPLSDVEGWQQDARTRVRQVADETGSGLVDMAPYQCDGDVCSDASRGTPVYDDPGHITMALSQLATPDFVAAIVAADTLD
ncbi:MAG: acyltransferase family protein [Actinobacteria bacterium]|nr:acyltransferase family protein [Actinomycetota bacterium]